MLHNIHAPVDLFTPFHTVFSLLLPAYNREDGMQSASLLAAW